MALGPEFRHQAIISKEHSHDGLGKPGGLLAHMRSVHGHSGDDTSGLAAKHSKAHGRSHTAAK